MDFGVLVSENVNVDFYKYWKNEKNFLIEYMLNLIYINVL